ncbi:MAG: hypothetical protein ACI9XU_001035, partial [Arenicella sp.]
KITAIDNSQIEPCSNSSQFHALKIVTFRISVLPNFYQKSTITTNHHRDSDRIAHH